MHYVTAGMADLSEELDRCLDEEDVEGLEALLQEVWGKETAINARGAALEAISARGASLVGLACREGAPRILELLMDHGVDITDITDDQQVHCISTHAAVSWAGCRLYTQVRVDLGYMLQSTIRFLCIFLESGGHDALADPGGGAHPALPLTAADL